MNLLTANVLVILIVTIVEAKAAGEPIQFVPLRIGHAVPKYVYSIPDGHNGTQGETGQKGGIAVYGIPHGEDPGHAGSVQGETGGGQTDTITGGPEQDGKGPAEPGVTDPSPAEPGVTDPIKPADVGAGSGGLKQNCPANCDCCKDMDLEQKLLLILLFQAKSGRFSGGMMGNTNCGKGLLDLLMPFHSRRVSRGIHDNFNSQQGSLDLLGGNSGINSGGMLGNYNTQQGLLDQSGTWGGSSGGMLGNINTQQGVLDQSGTWGGSSGGMLGNTQQGVLDQSGTWGGSSGGMFGNINTHQGLLDFLLRGNSGSNSGGCGQGSLGHPPRGHSGSCSGGGANLELFIRILLKILDYGKSSEGGSQSHLSCQLECGAMDCCGGIKFPSFTKEPSGNLCDIMCPQTKGYDPEKEKTICEIICPRSNFDVIGKWMESLIRGRERDPVPPLYPGGLNTLGSIYDYLLGVGGGPQGSINSGQGLLDLLLRGNSGSSSGGTSGIGNCLQEKLLTYLLLRGGNPGMNSGGIQGNNNSLQRQLDILLRGNSGRNPGVYYPGAPNRPGNRNGSSRRDGEKRHRCPSGRRCPGRRGSRRCSSKRGSRRYSRRRGSRRCSSRRGSRRYSSRRGSRRCSRRRGSRRCSSGRNACSRHRFRSNGYSRCMKNFHSKRRKSSSRCSRYNCIRHKARLMRGYARRMRRYRRRITAYARG